MQARIHPFEKAGLGLAPFAFIGYSRETYQACVGAPIQPGASCDYCGTGITDVFAVQSADGKRSKVGCECIRKVASKGEKILTEVEQEVRRIQRERRHARERAKIDAGLALLEQNRERLAQMPHPAEWAAEQGKTMIDYADWYLKNAGNKGKIEMFARIARKLNG